MAEGADLDGGVLVTEESQRHLTNGFEWDGANGTALLSLSPGHGVELVADRE